MAKVAMATSVRRRSNVSRASEMIRGGEGSVLRRKQGTVF